MSDADGTCEYVLDPDDPETWGGEEGDECYVDEEVLNEDGVWTCPHDAEENEDLCIFHLPVDEKNDEIVIDTFLDILDETGDESDTRKLQFLGGQFGRFDLSNNSPFVTSEMESLLMNHSIFSGDLDWSEMRIGGVTILEGADFGGDTKFDRVKFESGTSFIGATFVKDSKFRNTKFGGNTYFNDAEFKCSVDFSSAKFDGEAHFKQTRFRDFTRFTGGVSFDEKANFESAEFDEGAHFGDATFTGNAYFYTTEFAGVSFTQAEFRNRVSLGKAKIIEGVDFKRATFGDSIVFNYSELGDADFEFAEFQSNVYFVETIFGEKTSFHGAVFREFAEFDETKFGEIITFSEAAFKKQVIFNHTALENAEFNDADLTGASFVGTSLCGTNLELTLLSRATLFGADLRGAKLSGAVLGDVRIDEDTKFLGHPSDDSDTSPHTFSAIRSQPKCVYDPSYKEDNEHEDVDKAKSVYRALEELGGKHARPRLQARSFVRRQDLQKDEYKRDAKEAESWEGRLIAGARWSRARVARATLLYGESPWRVIGWSLGIILSFALLFPLGGWMKPEGGDPITYTQIASNPVEILNSIYYSTLTYTALGFGDFKPVGLGKALTTIETGLGAVMLALLVFILGRRAAR